MPTVTKLTTKQQILTLVSKPVVTWSLQVILLVLLKSSLRAKMFNMAITDMRNLCLTEGALPMLRLKQSRFYVVVPIYIGREVLTS